MPPLHRHQLACLTAAGWEGIRARLWDAQARACIGHWASHRLPLVVTRQPAVSDPAQTSIALGLPAPTAWGRRRLALEVPRDALAWFDEFPAAAEAASLLPRESRAAWRALCRALASCGAAARVYGSHGWQLKTGLAYLREGSDVDLWIAVEDALQADAVAGMLAAFASAHGPRLDGELVFSDGAAVAWREWQAWRAGRVRQLLVKRLEGAFLADASFAGRSMTAPELAS